MFGVRDGKRSERSGSHAAEAAVALLGVHQHEGENHQPAAHLAVRVAVWPQDCHRDLQKAQPKSQRVSCGSQYDGPSAF